VRPGADRDRAQDAAAPHADLDEAPTTLDRHPQPLAVRREAHIVGPSRHPDGGSYSSRRIEDGDAIRRRARDRSRQTVRIGREVVRPGSDPRAADQTPPRTCHDRHGGLPFERHERRRLTSGFDRTAGGAGLACEGIPGRRLRRIPTAPRREPTNDDGRDPE